MITTTILICVNRSSCRLQERLLFVIFECYGAQVYGNAVNNISHMSDVWRVDFMIKYGGIYVDTDVVFVRPLDRKIRGYDAVATYEWAYVNHPFPDTINFGVALGKRNAPFWHKFQVMLHLLTRPISPPVGQCFLPMSIRLR